PQFLVLHRINPDLGARAAAGRNGQIEAVESLSLPAKVTGRAAAENRGNLGEQRIVVRIILLKDVNESLSSRHVDAFVFRAVIQIIGVLPARKRSDHTACARVHDRKRGRLPGGHKEPVIGFIESYGKGLTTGSQT